MSDTTKDLPLVQRAQAILDAKAKADEAQKPLRDGTAPWPDMQMRHAHSAKEALDKVCRNHVEPVATFVAGIPPCFKCGKDSLIILVGEKAKHPICEEHMPEVLDFMKKTVEQGTMVQEAEAKLAAAAQEMLQLVDESTKLAAQMDEVTASRNHLLGELRQIADMLCAHDSEPKSILAMVSKLIREVNALRTQDEKHRAALLVAADRISRAESSAAALREENAVNEKIHKGLIEENRQLKAGHANAHQLMADAVKEVERLRAQLAEVQKAHDEAHQIMSEGTQQCVRLRGELHQVKINLTQAEAAVEKLKAEKFGLEKIVFSLQKQNDEALKHYRLIQRWAKRTELPDNIIVAVGRLGAKLEEKH